jgi:DNA gyrase/topoisomerase IV subunit A
VLGKNQDPREPVESLEFSRKSTPIASQQNYGCDKLGLECDGQRTIYIQNNRWATKNDHRRVEVETNNFENHFTRSQTAIVENKNMIQEIESELKSKKAKFQRLKRLDRYLVSNQRPAKIILKSRGLVSKGQPILVVVFNRGVNKFLKLKSCVAQQIVPNRVLTEQECLALSKDFLKQIQEKMGLNDQYRYLYSKDGEPINNVITINSKQTLILLGSFPDFYGKQALAHKISADDMGVFYQKIEKIENRFLKEYGLEH